MKGVVFKEFLTMVESKFGEEMVETIIDESSLKSKGAYTSVGTYDHDEILQLVTRLSQKSSLMVSTLVKAFGKHLVSIFNAGYPDFFKHPNLFSFLKSVDSVIHIEVRKLYPDSELPKFTYEQPDENRLIMNYSSSRPFADLAEGLIQGSIEHFKEQIELSSVDTSDGKGTSRRFILKKVSS